MSETALTKPKRKTSADYEALAAQLLADMERLEAQMDKTYMESERLKAETQIIKAETEIIKARTTSTLSQLALQMNRLTEAS